MRLRSRATTAERRPQPRLRRAAMLASLSAFFLLVVQGRSVRAFPVRPFARALRIQALRLYVYDLPEDLLPDLAGPATQRSGCRVSLYGAEVQLVDALRGGSLPQDVVLTRDGNDADLFFVPLLATCISHQGGWNATNGYNAILAAQEWMSGAHPFWNRSLGADHVWMSVHDVGREYASSAVMHNSIFLLHSSSSVDVGGWFGEARVFDEKLRATSSLPGEPGGCKSPEKIAARKRLGQADDCHFIRGTGAPMCGGNNNGGTVFGPGTLLGQPYGYSSRFPEFNMWRDLALPTTTTDAVVAVHKSGAWRTRTPEQRAQHLVYFRGKYRTDFQLYSFGVRQRLYDLYANDTSIAMLEGHTPNYTDELMSSTFCLSLPGNAMWSPRLIDAILLGCIPIIMTDGVALPFHPLLDWRKFSVRILQKDLHRLKDIVLSLSPARIADMRAALADAAPAFVYNVPMQTGDAGHMVMQQLKLRAMAGAKLAHDLQTPWGYDAAEQGGSGSMEASLR
jgi:hypothetical protein